MGAGFREINTAYASLLKNVGTHGIASALGFNFHSIQSVFNLLPFTVIAVKEYTVSIIILKGIGIRIGFRAERTDQVIITVINIEGNAVGGLVRAKIEPLGGHDPIAFRHSELLHFHAYILTDE